MFDRISRFPVNGSNALEPKCSRYSNENERIIDFEAAARRHTAHLELQSAADERAMARVRLAKRLERLAAESETVQDIRTRSARGTHVSDIGKPYLASVFAAYALGAATVALLG